MAKIKIFLACSLMLFCMGACRINPFIPLFEQDSTSDSSLSLDELRFSDPQNEERFLTLDACINDYTSGDDEWRNSGYETLGNFFESRWCRGAGTRANCHFGDIDRRDQHIIQLHTFFFSASYPEVFGVYINGLRVPAEEGWAVSFGYAEDSKTIMGNDVNLSFRYYVPDKQKPTHQVSIVGPFMYRVGETRFRAPETLSLSTHEKLAEVLESPESMRDMAIHYYQAIATEVDAALQGGEISTCDYGEYQGDGIKPVCTPRPFTDDELTAELKRADEYFASQQALLEENYREMYTTLFQAFPFDRCQP
jgi:hypothetical protein